MGSICPKKEQESDTKVHPKINSHRLNDEETQKLSNNRGNVSLNNSGVAPPRKQDTKRDLKPPPAPVQEAPKVVGQYEIKAKEDEKKKKQEEEAARLAAEQERKRLEEIELQKAQKKNQTDDFSSRWSEELHRRGVTKSQGVHDPTDLTTVLQGSISPTLRKELADTNQFGASASVAESKVDTIKTDYLLEVDLDKFLAALNSLRTSPKNFSGILRNKYLNMLDSMSCHRTTLRLYEEGKSVIAEAVKTLENVPNLNGLKLDAGLCVAAHLQAKRQAYEMKVYGVGRESEVLPNLSRFAKVPEGAVVKDCNLKTLVLDYEDIIANMYISDNDSSRRNRLSLVQDGVTKAGLGIFQKTKKSPIFCCVMLSGNEVQGNKSQIPKDLLNDAGASKL